MEKRLYHSIWPSAFALSQNQRVLLVDMDPQASLTHSLLNKVGAQEWTCGAKHLMMRDATASDFLSFIATN